MEATTYKMTPVPVLPRRPPGRVVIFSGHMVDAPGRSEPRFPAEKEGAVRHRLAGRLEAWEVGPGDLVISGAARGGDLLFAGLCAARGAEVWLFLPLPVEEFLDESVRLPGGHWEKDFHLLLSHPGVQCFIQRDYVSQDHDGLSIHARNNLWMIDAARLLAPAPASLLALLVWDEKATGDGPGGTSDFVDRVRRLGGEIAPPINPLELKVES